MTLAETTQSETAQQRPSMLGFPMRRRRARSQAALQSLRTAIAATVKKPVQASGGGRKADALGARRGVKDGVVGAHEHVAQDPERAGRRRQVEAHEAGDALLLPARAHLPTAKTRVRLVAQIAIDANREGSRSRPRKPKLGCSQLPALTCVLKQVKVSDAPNTIGTPSRLVGGSGQAGSQHLTFRQASCSDNPGRERRAKTGCGEAWPSVSAEQALAWDLVQGRTRQGRDCGPRTRRMEWLNMR